MADTPGSPPRFWPVPRRPHAAGAARKGLGYNRPPFFDGPKGPHRSPLMDWLISSAWAQASPGAAPSGLVQMLPLVVIFIVFYFLLIRPQSKRAKEPKAMVAALAAGDEVVTSGGILGRVTEIADQFLTVEIADGVRVKV